MVYRSGTAGGRFVYRSGAVKGEFVSQKMVFGAWREGEGDDCLANNQERSARGSRGIEVQVSAGQGVGWGVSSAAADVLMYWARARGLRRACASDGSDSASTCSVSAMRM